MGGILLWEEGEEARRWEVGEVSIGGGYECYDIAIGLLASHVYR